MVLAIAEAAAVRTAISKITDIPFVAASASASILTLLSQYSRRKGLAHVAFLDAVDGRLVFGPDLLSYEMG